jgi:UV DNA damage endonuclease
MRLGYPCINLSLSCRSSTTFRLSSFSAERFRSTVSANLQCLSETLAWNSASGVLFFRITSGLIPFASHPVNSLGWQDEFRKEFRHIGSFIRENRMRVSMHPDQFVVLNAKNEGIVERSTAELLYHSDVLDLLGTGSEAKVQIHLGGVYGDKAASIGRFTERAEALPRRVLKRLVIENDERLYSLMDCLAVHEKTGLPVVLDTLHHACNNNRESMREAILLAGKTWRRQDGPPIIDFSTQEKGRRLGTHAQTIDLRHFRTFLSQVPDPGDRGPDIMLEIKDKDRSALKALRLVMALSKTGKTSRRHP